MQVSPVVNICKFYNIKNVACLNLENPLNKIFWLDNNKSFMPYLETHVIDSCNLNCKACLHYANLFSDDDIYNLEDFRRDLRQVSENVDVVRFRLLGGEPLKMENLDQYIKITRQYLPDSTLRIITNGLLIPTAQQKIFDAMRENSVGFDISAYPPTMKIADKITDRLTKNNIFYTMNKPVEYFFKRMGAHRNHDPLKSLKACSSSICRFLRAGKIYKCPIDALSYKFVEYFNIKNFPLSTGVDIYAKNFSLMLEQLNGSSVELCSWCTGTTEEIDWKIENKPKLSDWIVD